MLSYPTPSVSRVTDSNFSTNSSTNSTIAFDLLPVPSSSNVTIYVMALTITFLVLIVLFLLYRLQKSKSTWHSLLFGCFKSNIIPCRRAVSMWVSRISDWPSNDGYRNRFRCQLILTASITSFISWCGRCRWCCPVSSRVWQWASKWRLWHHQSGKYATLS